MEERTSESIAATAGPDYKAQCVIRHLKSILSTPRPLRTRADVQWLDPFLLGKTRKPEILLVMPVTLLNRLYAEIPVTR